MSVSSPPKISFFYSNYFFENEGIDNHFVFRKFTKYLTSEKKSFTEVMKTLSSKTKLLYNKIVCNRIVILLK